MVCVALGTHFQRTGGHGLLHSWVGWDGGWYLFVAAHGYGLRLDAPEHAGAPAFYPLYPGLVRIVGAVFGGHLGLAAVVVSLAASLLGFALVHRLCALRFGSEQARWAVVFLAVFPYAPFLQFGYSESLFLALAAGTLLAIERDRFVLAGVVCGLAMLTRPVAIALVVVLALTAASRRRARAGTVGIAVAALVFSVYGLVLRLCGRSALAFLHAEHLWHRDLASSGPLTGLSLGLRAGWAALLQLTSGAEMSYWATDDALINLTSLVALGLLALGTVIVFWKCGAAWGAYCVVGLALPLSVPDSVDLTPLVSLGRFALAFVPVFVALPSVIPGRVARLAVTSVSASALVGVVIWWTSGRFVA